MLLPKYSNHLSQYINHIYFTKYKSTTQSYECNEPNLYYTYKATTCTVKTLKFHITFHYILTSGQSLRITAQFKYRYWKTKAKKYLSISSIFKINKSISYKKEKKR